LYICIIWFLISSLSLEDRSAHKLREVGKQDFYYIRMQGQQTIKIPIE